MKKIQFVISLMLIIQASVFSQTYRNMVEMTEGAFGGQGWSYCDNSGNALNVHESGILQAYLDIFKSTKDKKYLDKFIIEAKRAEEQGGLGLGFPTRTINENDTKDSVVQTREFGIELNGSANRQIPTFPFNYYDLLIGKKSITNYGIEIGVVFLDREKRFVSTNLTLGFSYDQLKSQADVKDSPNVRKDIFQYSTLNIPAAIGIKKKLGKCAIEIEPGIQLGILLTNKYQSLRPYYEVEESPLSNYQFLMYLTLGGKFIYSVNHRLSFFAGYQFIQSINQLVYKYTTTMGENESSYFFLHYNVVQFGLSYQFKLHSQK